MFAVRSGRLSGLRRPQPAGLGPRLDRQVVEQPAVTFRRPRLLVGRAASHDSSANGPSISNQSTAIPCPRYVFIASSWASRSSCGLFAAPFGRRETNRSSRVAQKNSSVSSWFCQPVNSTTPPSGPPGTSNAPRIRLAAVLTQATWPCSGGSNLPWSQRIGPAADAELVPAGNPLGRVADPPRGLGVVRLAPEPIPLGTFFDATVPFFPVLAQIPAFFVEPRPHFRRLRGRSQPHGPVDGDLGRVQVAGQLDVRDLLGRGDVVEPVGFRVGRQHLLELQPRGGQQVAERELVLDRVKSPPADPAECPVAVGPGGVQGGRGQPDEPVEVVRFRPVPHARAASRRPPRDRGPSPTSRG